MLTANATFLFGAKLGESESVSQRSQVPQKYFPGRGIVTFVYVHTLLASHLCRNGERKCSNTMPSPLTSSFHFRFAQGPGSATPTNDVLPALLRWYSTPPNTRRETAERSCHGLEGAIKQNPFQALDAASGLSAHVVWDDAPVSCAPCLLAWTNFHSDR